MYIKKEFFLVVIVAFCSNLQFLQASTLKVYNTGSTDIEVQMKWSLKGDFVNFSTVSPGQATSCEVPSGAYWLRAKVGGEKGYSASLAFVPVGESTYNYYVNKNGDLLSGVECRCTLGAEKELSFTTMAAQCSECKAACSAVTETIITAATLPLGLGSAGAIKLAFTQIARTNGFKFAAKLIVKQLGVVGIGAGILRWGVPRAVGLYAIAFAILGLYIEGECLAQ